MLGLTGYYLLPLHTAGKESACDVGDLGLMSGLGRSPGEGKGYALHKQTSMSASTYIYEILYEVWDAPVFSTFRFLAQRFAK